MEHVASTMQRLMSEEVNHRRLYIIQTYNIGKERVFIEVRICMSGHSSVETSSPYLIKSALLQRAQPLALHIELAEHLASCCTAEAERTGTCLDAIVRESCL